MHADIVVMRTTMSTEEIILQELRSLLNMTSTQHIDVQVSFQTLGGNSLLALKLVKQCKKHGLRLLVNSILQSKSVSEVLASVCQSDPQGEEQLPEQAGFRFLKSSPEHFSDAAGVDVDSGIESCGTESPRFMSTLPSDEEDEGINTKNTSSLIKAGGLQFSLVHESTRIPGTNIIQHAEVYKPSDIPRVKAGWRTIWDQEAILRTRYAADLVPYEVRQFDWEELSIEDPKEYEKWIRGAHTPAKNTFGSLWRVVRLVNASENKSAVIWAIHHALIDGYSAQLLLAKMRMAASGGCIFPGPAFSAISRRLDRLREQNKEDGNAFWEKAKELHAQAATMLQYPPPSEPPCPKKDMDSELASLNYGEAHINLGAGWNRRVLSGIAKEAGVTPAVIYHAAWALIMTMFADSNTICFGTALSGRNLPISGIEDAIGPLLNTLPLALCIKDAATTLRELARQTQQRLNQLTQYSWTTPENGFSRNFQCALAMQFQMDDYSADLADDEVGMMGVDAIRPLERPFTRQKSNVPLSILVDEAYDHIRLQYNFEDFSPRQIENLGTVYGLVLQSFVRLDTPVSLVQNSLITPEAQREFENWGNCLSSSTSPFSVVDDLVTLFERAVDQNPENIATQTGCTGPSMTYRELDTKASIVARSLNDDHGVRPGDVICVDANRSPDWLVSIFAVLKTGAAYCALDCELPQHLRSVMFAKTGAKVFLASTREVADRRGPKESALTLSVEELINNKVSSEIRGWSGNSLNMQRRDIPMPESTAYVCFTSGSTGTPKGVVCTHQGLVAFQRDLQVRLFAEPGVKVAQVMSPAFDGSIHEIFSALCHGATLVLPPPGDTNVTDALSLAHSAILTPSLAEVLDPADYPILKYVYLVGEQVKQAVNNRWGAAKTLYNMYGPTEGTGGATIKRLLPGHPVTIGRPNPSSRVYILSSSDSVSETLRLMPPGTVGEICVAGVQVARGYLGMPELTSERFVPDPFCRTGTGDYLYKTGDRGYWTTTGELVCLGRQDRQIKLRGFRLDLNDLEARVMQAATPRLDGFKSVAIAQRDDYLVAAIQPARLSLSIETITAVLADVLPVYAQPRHVLFLDEWPMTRAGKLDYSCLVSDRFIDQSTEKNKAARLEANGRLQALLTPLECKVASVWREVLGLNPCEPIARQSNFLQLGGDSLRQITMLSKLSSCLKTKLPLKMVIESRTLGELTSRLQAFDPRLRNNVPPLPHYPSSAQPEAQIQTVSLRLPRCTSLSPIELSWWTSYRLHPRSNTSAFNVSFVASLGPDANHAALCRALDSVVSRYSLFRGRYVPVDVGETHGDRSHGFVERRYVEHPPKVQRLQHLNIWVEVNKPFDLERESPVRMSMTSDTVAIVMSHIVADLTTLNILLRDVGLLYQGKTLSPAVRSYELETVPAMWRNEVSPCDLQFWAQYLRPSSAPPQGILARPERHGYCGTSRLYLLSDGLAKRMHRFCTGQRSGNSLSLQQMAVAAVGLATSATQNRDQETGEVGVDETDVILGTPFINRSTTDDMETVGLFLEPLPVRVCHSASKSNSKTRDALDFLESVRSSANAALAHAVPWYRLLAHLTDSSSNSSLQRPATEPIAPFDTMVTFHNAENGIRIEIPGVVPRMTWADGAKFSLMTEFTALANGSVILRNEYDTRRYSTEDIDRLVSATAAAIDMLIANEHSIVEIKQTLRASLPVLHHSLISSIQKNSFDTSSEDLAATCPGNQLKSISESLVEKTAKGVADDESYMSRAKMTICKRVAGTMLDQTSSAENEQMFARSPGPSRKRARITKKPRMVGATV